MNRNSLRTVVRIGLMAAVSCAAVLIATWPEYGIYLYGQNDFLAIYAGAKLAFTDQLYDPDTVLNLQIEAAGASGPILRFSRLPGYAMILAPLGFLPYVWAYVLWQCINLAAVIGAVVVWPYNRSLFASVLAVCLPMYLGFAGGQDVPIIVFGVALFFRLLESGRRGWAGLGLGICLIKFHFLWAVVLVLLRYKLYRPILGLALAGLVLVLPGFLFNPQWPLEYYSAIITWRVDAEKITYTLFPVIGWVGLPVAAVVAWIASARFPVQTAVSIAIAAAVLVSPNGYIADFTLMAPLVALMWDP